MKERLIHQMTPDELEERGVEAIIFLQSLKGITESHRKARLGWLLMSTKMQQQTLMAYNALKHTDTN